MFHERIARRLVEFTYHAERLNGPESTTQHSRNDARLWGGGSACCIFRPERCITGYRLPSPYPDISLLLLATATAAAANVPLLL